MEPTEMLDTYCKEFETETSQIQYWFATLKATNSQVSLLRDSIDQELKLQEAIGTIFQNTGKLYLTETKDYSAEPSNLYKDMLIFTEFLDTTGKILCNDLLSINNYSQKISSSIINDLNSVSSNIKENSYCIMNQILKQRKISKSLQIRYEKLKTELDQANLQKKKIETDPKRVYNVTIKEKAEQNVITLIRKMEELLPLIQKSLKDLENKTELFNKFMKETFELVIANKFKNSIIMIKNYFKIFQDREQVWENLKSTAVELRNKFRDSDVIINDYSEKKYAESKGVFFDCSDSFAINGNVLDVSFIKTIDDMHNYAVNFFTCMRMRKRILQPFAKLILDVFKCEETACYEYKKINDSINENLQNFTQIGEVGMNNWDIIRSAFDQNQKMHDLLGKFLESNILKMIFLNSKESKIDYTDFSENFIKQYSKDFSNSKSIIMKYHKNREKLIDEIKSLRTQINKENGRTISKLESKLKILQKEENDLKLSHEEIGKKLKLNLTNCLEVLHKQTESIRSRESKRIVTFVDSMESVIKTFEKIFSQNSEISKNIIEVIAHTDIYLEMRSIYEKYFVKFEINNYEVYFDKIFKKILANFNLNQIETNERQDLIIDNIKKVSLNKPYKPENLSIDVLEGTYVSPNINNFISNNQQDYNQNIPFSKSLAQFNSGSSENFVSLANFKDKIKLPDNNLNEIEIKNLNDKYHRSRSEVVHKNLIIDKKINYQSKINRISINEINNMEKKYFQTNNFDNRQMQINEETSLYRDNHYNEISQLNHNSQFVDRKNKNEYLSKFNEIRNIAGENSQNDVELISIKSEVINLNHKPDLHLSDEKTNENIITIENNEKNSLEDNIESSSSSSGEDNIDFVNTANLKFIDFKNPYNNFKENDLKNYMQMIKTDMNDASKTQKETNTKKDQDRNMNKFFELEENELVVGKYSCAFSEKILLQGKLYITNKKLVFYSWFNSNFLLIGSTKLIIPMIDILNVEKKKNLKIFDNSIKITTNRSDLFFTSFVQRDACFKAINQYWSIIKNDLIEQNNIKKIEENLNFNEIENQDQNILNKADTMPIFGRNKFSSKAMVTNRILKKIDFLNRLETIHKQRLSEFQSIPFDNLNLQASFKPENFFKKFYVKDESLGNCPLPLIFNSIFKHDVICDEMQMDKTFWMSIYESRKDYDIIYTEIPSNELKSENNLKIPKFMDDLDYFMSLFSNIDQDHLNEFLDDVSKWPKNHKFSYACIHPIKKKIVGPDRLKLREEFSCYFVSPKLFVVEITCFGINFPYAENFVTFTQYRFNTNYKFSAVEGVFKFNTTVSLMFTIHFIKSCIFSSIIESEGHKESEENLKFFIYEKVRIVLDNQTENFNQHFNKLNEENMRRTINNFFNKNSEHMPEYKTTPTNRNNLLENEEDENECGVDEGIPEETNENDIKGWKIKHVNELEIKSNYGIIPAFSINFYKNHFISVFIIGIVFYILSNLTPKTLVLLGLKENILNSSLYSLFTLGISIFCILYTYFKLM